MLLLKSLNENKHRCVIIDASLNEKEINKIIISKINQLISLEK